MDDKMEDDISQEEECFYELCTKHTTCSGYLTYGKWKSRNLSIMCCAFTTMIASLLIAVIVPLLIYSLIDTGINDEVVIDSTSAPNYEAWSTNAYGTGFDDVKVKYKLSFFDLQNPMETLAGEKPIVVEKGPYVYDEYFIKFDIEWSDGGDTVTYNNQRYYIFNREETAGGLSPDDTFLLPYPAVIGFEMFLNEIPPEANEMLDDVMLEKVQNMSSTAIAYMNLAYAAAGTLPPPFRAQYQGEVQSANASLQVLFNDLSGFISRSSPVKVLLKTILCQVPSGVSPFYTVKPGDAWFGYLNDPVLYAVGDLIKNIEVKIQQSIPWSAALPGAAVNWTSIPDTRRRRNRDTFKTGKKNVNQVSQYVYYQNMTMLRTCTASYKNPSQPYNEGTEWPACPYYYQSWDDNEATIEANGYTIPWADDYANRVAGTDATMFGRPVTSDKLQVFISDIYRSAYLGHQENTEWYSVPVRRFVIQTKDLENTTTNPSNAQYFSYAPMGLLNTTKAAAAPVFVSFPHFYEGDPRLVEAVTGMLPNADTHACYLDIEPQTGLLARARKRLQVNYEMNNYDLPEVKDNSSAIAYETCLSTNETFAQINRLLIIQGATPDQLIPYLQCGNEALQGMLNCLSVPSTWKMRNDVIYFPYGWTSEELDLPESDANDLYDLLYGTEDIATNIRFWSLIVAGLSFAVLMGMMVHHYVIYREHHISYHALYRDMKGQQEALLGANASSIHNDPLMMSHDQMARDPLVASPATAKSNPLVSKQPQESYSFSS